uniref:Putative secreted peptide n=1 Tax=Anopheles braziliensis TaxID=58242 RepID=A0A2M3ZVW3_9DIPT
MHSILLLTSFASLRSTSWPGRKVHQFRRQLVRSSMEPYRNRDGINERYRSAWSNRSRTIELDPNGIEL